MAKIQMDVSEYEAMKENKALLEKSLESERVLQEQIKQLTSEKIKAKATKVFNAYIRERDKGKPCVSCGSYNTAHASHFYSGGHYSGLKFNEDNVHSACVRCNTFLHGNLNEYRIRLIKRIGLERVEKLDLLAAQYKRQGYKWNRFYLQEVIDTYKQKIKEP